MRARKDLAEGRARNKGERGDTRCRLGFAPLVQIRRVAEGRAAEGRGRCRSPSPLYPPNPTPGMKRQMIEDSAVFHNLSAASIVAIMDRLVSEIALPDEIVVLQGTTGDRMFFIAQGTVEVRVGVEEEEGGAGEEFEGWVALKQLHRGEAFGEMALMDPDNNRRTYVQASASVKA